MKYNSFDGMHHKWFVTLIDDVLGWRFRKAL
jgi:hypothetical protein